MWDSKGSGTTGTRLAGAVIGALFLAVAVLLFSGLFLVIGGPFHFLALMTIGILSLVFGGASYFAQALSREPTLQRMAAWGFTAFGFAILFLTVGVVPFLYAPDLLSQTAQIALLIVLILLLIAVVAVAAWRSRGHAEDAHRAAARREWASHPAPSAFSYPAAQIPENREAPASPPGPGGS